MIKVIRVIFLSEMRLASRQLHEILNPLVFFIMVVSLFPLAISPAPNLLRIIAPGVIWVAALLAVLLSLERLFRADFIEGMIENYLLSHQPAPLMIFAKIAAQWILTGLPLILLTPLLGILLALPWQGIFALMLSLLVGTPTLYLLGAIGFALIGNLRGGGMLVALLILPFYIPVLIFGVTIPTAAMDGLMILGQLALLGALLIFSIVLAPLVCAAALKISVQY